MVFQTNEDSVVFLNDSGNVKGKVEFEDIGNDVVDIKSVYVSPSERGMGLAGRLMSSCVRHLRFNGKKAKPTCSYAQKWFNEHQDSADILA
ncbi:MAG: GNAT family N-acetyltransferase [Atopobiaceae bacterium]|jgi:predicted GNAT family acetyltransferase